MVTDEQMIAALRDTTQTLTADIVGRDDSLSDLLHQLPARQRQPRNRRTLPAILAGAAVAASVTAVALVGAHLVGTVRTPAEPGTAITSGGPYPTSAYFLGQHARDHATPDTVVVRVSDGKTVTTLPRFGSNGLDSPVLSPDGTRIYAAWGANPAHLGYYDLTSGRRVTLDTRPGILIGPSVSADGNTLAYEWSATLGDPEHSTSVVILDLRNGATQVLRDAPAGPQVLSMALSPDGTRLAVVPTKTTSRPLLLVSTATSDAFRAATTISSGSCSTQTAEPRWTRHGLYALRFCGNNRVNLIAVDPRGGTTARIQQLRTGGITAFTPIPGNDGDLFAIADQTQTPPTTPVGIYDPGSGWSHRTVAGIDGLQEVTSE